MKRILGIALLSALFSLPLLAGSHSQDFLLPSEVRIGDAQLPAGHCKVAWTQPSGAQVQLTIKTEDKKTITIPAQVIEGKRGAAAVQTFVADGVRYVSEFDTGNARFIVKDPAKYAK
jgi:phenolic acid decarboxylase